jgi:hypothetical protein
MLERQKAKYGWEFLFIAATVDEMEVATPMQCACQLIGTNGMYYALITYTF